MLNNVLPLWTLPLCEEHSQVLKMQLQAGAEIPLLPLAALISRALLELRCLSSAGRAGWVQSWAAQHCLPCWVLLPFPCPHLWAASHQLLTAGRNWGLEWGFPLCTAAVAACCEHSPWSCTAGRAGSHFRRNSYSFKNYSIRRHENA